MKPKQLTVEIITGLFIVLFIYTGLSKILGIQKFLGQMMMMPFPHWLAYIAAFGTPILEINIAVLLILSKTKREGLLAATGLMMMFTVYVALILNKVFGSHYPCSCGGVISAMNWKEHLVFNIFFVMLGILALLLNRENQQHQHSESSDELPMKPLFK